MTRALLGNEGYCWYSPSICVHVRSQKVFRLIDSEPASSTSYRMLEYEDVVCISSKSVPASDRRMNGYLEVSDFTYRVDTKIQDLTSDARVRFKTESRLTHHLRSWKEICHLPEIIKSRFVRSQTQRRSKSLIPQTCTGSYLQSKLSSNCRSVPPYSMY
jgi:hypothetical protein